MPLDGYDEGGGRRGIGCGGVSVSELHIRERLALPLLPLRLILVTPHPESKINTMLILFFSILYLYLGNSS